MTAMRRPPGAFTGTPYITAREIADRLGILETSVRTQMRAMRRRKTDPVDFRVPADERPADVGRHVTLYWRADVERWLRARADRAARRARRAPK